MNGLLKNSPVLFHRSLIRILTENTCENSRTSHFITLLLALWNSNFSVVILCTFPHRFQARKSCLQGDILGAVVTFIIVVGSVDKIRST